MTKKERNLILLLLGLLLSGFATMIVGALGLSHH